jgi:hypothetical protein
MANRRKKSFGVSVSLLYDAQLLYDMIFGIDWVQASGYQLPLRPATRPVSVQEAP